MNHALGDARADDAGDLWPRSSTRRWALHVCFGVMALAALLKFEDVTLFTKAVGTWSFVRPEVAPVIAITVWAMELLVSGMWFLRLGRRLAAIAGLSMIVVFSGLLLFEMVRGETPDCGCLGRLRLFESGRTEIIVALGRNAGLVLLFIFAALPRLRIGARSAPDVEAVR